MIIRTLFLILMCCVMLLCGCGEGPGGKSTVFIEPNPVIHVDNPEEENMAGILQKVASGVMVQIQNGDIIGSGVLWDFADDKLVIATAAHILTMGTGEMEVIFADGWKTSISQYEMTDTDMAFLFVECDKIPGEQLANYYLVRRDMESASRLQRGDGIILMASGTGVAADAYEGEVAEPWIYVEDFAEHMIVVRVNAENGMSGGGLFDYEGHFLGILCGKSEDGEAAVLPLFVINALYDGF